MDNETREGYASQNQRNKQRAFHSLILPALTYTGGMRRTKAGITFCIAAFCWASAASGYYFYPASGPVRTGSVIWLILGLVFAIWGVAILLRQPPPAF
jgi:hypothetical protein